jgi:hypothetical protein
MPVKEVAAAAAGSHVFRITVFGSGCAHSKLRVTKVSRGLFQTSDDTVKTVLGNAFPRTSCLSQARVLHRSICEVWPR